MEAVKAALLVFLLAWPSVVSANPPAWAKAVKTTVTKTADSEDVIVEVNGVKAGRRQDATGVYDLVWERDPTLLGLKHRLHPHKVTKVFPAERDPLSAPAILGDAVAAPASQADPAPVVVDVNMLYSAAALVKIGGPTKIDAFAALSCALATQSYANSGLGWITFRCLGPFQTAYNEATDGNALDWMAGPVGNAEIQQRYGQTGADLSHMVTTNGACGQGYMTVTASYALSMSEWDCTNSNLSMPHETGHNMGMHHDPANAQCGALVTKPSGLQGCASGYNYGHAWPIGAIQWRDVMSYPGAGGARVTQFSSPLVLYQGQWATGIANERDNARVAFDRAATVAGFRTPVTVPLPPPQPPGKTKAVTGQAFVTLVLSPDNSTIINGQAVVLNYTVAYRRVSDGVVTDTVNCGKPANGNCTIPLSVPGTVLYTATATAVGPGGSSAGPASDPFTKVAVTHKPSKFSNFRISQ
jgi:hypothetical protein